VSPLPTDEPVPSAPAATADAAAATGLAPDTAAAKRTDALRAGRVALCRWRCRVRAYVGTHHVSVELRTVGRSLRLQTVRSVRRPVAAAAPQLEAALQTLGDALEELRRTSQADVGRNFGGVACEVILADAWLVYDVVPVDLARLSPALAHQAIAAALADIVGAPASTLWVRWQRQRDGRAAFGMALNRNDLDALRSVVTAHRLRLAAVTGEFIAVLNAQRAVLPSDRTVVAIVREAGTQIATLAGGDVALAQFELGLADAAALPAVAQRALSARGLESAATINFCVDMAGRSAADSGAPEGAAAWRWLPAPAWTHST